MRGLMLCFLTNHKQKSGNCPHLTTHYGGGDLERCCPQIYFVPDGLHWYEQRTLNPDWSLGTSPCPSLVQKMPTITQGDTHTLLVSQMLLKLGSSENYEGNSQHTNKPCLALLSQNISSNCVEQIDLLVYHPKRRSGCDKMLMLWRCSVEVFSNLYQCIAIPGEFLQIITHRRTDGRI